jgi:hypothetical protein
MSIEDAIRAAEDAGLPARVAPKLVGDSLEELRADAVQLAADLGRPVPRKATVPLPDTHAGARPDGQPSGTDLLLAASRQRMGR